VCALVLVAASSCRTGPAPDAGPIQISLTSAASSRERDIAVTGLSSTELVQLRDARWDERAWQSLLRVTVTDDAVDAIAGRYSVTDSAVIFRPRFGFDPGRTYKAALDLARLPTPRQSAVVIAHVRIDAQASTGPAASVAAIYPSAAEWPENMLRFYIHFSGPMSRGAGTKYVHLLDAQANEIPDAILAAYSDLWNPDTTRLTVFFDPGRVKRGVGPNVALGRAIVAGRRYAIQVDREWPDAAGRPLMSSFRREFMAAAAAYKALTARDWRIAAPAANAQNPLVVTFPAPLDRALLERAIAVRTADDKELAGEVKIGTDESSWTFTPSAPWRAGEYQLAVLTVLEDPAGNKIGRAFEVLPTDPSESSSDPDLVRLPFTITR
jgi:hypothetical protein